ncbi:ABC transporter permease subunit [Venatoribacter cucullus]|uniref:ABC transporter permease subunit n=1 Tax=Venatoribacter cucullus TaxID=2661630 RepID=A0A9X7USX4_9GAMM|nr:ABC transporter permease [Venatoribacter cucullus]QQD23117.1 ABC transporter permease subunit [Venatoribacter cucullus]
MWQTLSNIYRLGIKELWSLWRDPAMLLLVIYTFTGSLYVAATAAPETLHKATIAVVDEDRSQLSARLIGALYPPQFMPPADIPLYEMDRVLDEGRYTFVLNIPPDFEKDTLAGLQPALQLNVDATRMSQAFTGNGYISQIISSEAQDYVRGYRAETHLPAELALRARFNPALEHSWFGSVMELINSITMISIILTGAALIREREHGTVEHLLVMPLGPAQIMLSKVWSMGLVVMLMVWLALQLIIQGALAVPIEGSLLLFMLCVALHLTATTSMAIFMATVARTMPQFGLLLILVLLPLQLLSGGMTPRESMPEFIQTVMLAAPTTHFVKASQAVLYRGAGIDVIWPQLLSLALIAGVLFTVALKRFRRTISQMA